MSETQTSPTPYVTVKGCARELGVSPMTIYRLVNSGTLRHTVLNGRTKRILRSDWKAYLDARTQGGDHDQLA